MKKNLLITLILALALSLALFSCGSGDCTHTDEDENLICDKCGEELDEGGEGEEPLECQHSDIDGNLLCDECGEELEDDGGTPPEHTHSYTQKVTEDKYMYAGASCESPAQYYFSCSCGECGEDLFTSGEPLTYHSMKVGVCSLCGALESSAGLKFEPNPDGKSYTLKSFGECMLSEIRVGTYQGFSVTAIAPGAFNNLFVLRDIIISNTVVEIGDSAFKNCSNLESISIPGSVTKIGNSAFWGCENLYNVFITDVKAWCEISFDGSFATPLVFADNFVLNGEPVVDLVLPEGVTKINGNAFYGYDTLESVSIPSTVESVGAGAFSECDYLAYNEYDNAYYLGNESNPYLLLVKAKSTDISSCNIHESTKIIYASAFRDCVNLASIEIPTGALEINYSAFAGCSSLSAVTLPEGIKSIAANTFELCASLESITVPSTVEKIGDRAFFGCSALADIKIPDSVVVIGDYAFGGCDLLTYTEYENALYLGNDANPHRYLISAKSETIESCTVHPNAKYICGYAFYECKSLVSILISQGVSSIGAHAFEYCSSLVSVSISDTVTSIGLGAFVGCDSLTEITVDEKNTVYKSIDGNLYSKDGKVLIKYADGKSDKSFVIPEGVEEILYGAFTSSEILESLTIPDSVKKIDSYALATLCLKELTTSVYALDYLDKSELVSVTITSGTVIPSHAFSGCQNLLSVEICDTVYKISDFAFNGCTSLSSITIPEKVTYIGQQVFSGCTSLASAIFEKTEGWSYSYYSTESGTAIPKADLEDPEAAADKLRVAYAYYCLKRTSYDSLLDIVPKP